MRNPGLGIRLITITLFVVGYATLTPVASAGRSSRLAYRDSCGWQGSGRGVYIQNLQRNRPIVATVRESFNSGRDRWTKTTSYRLEPGAEQRVGCTRGDTATEFKSYSVMGER